MFGKTRIEWVKESKVRSCDICGERIAFVLSKKGKWYPVNAGEPVDGYVEIERTDFHRCNTRPSYELDVDDLLALYREHLAANPKEECDWFTPNPQTAEEQRIAEITEARHWYDFEREASA